MQSPIGNRATINGRERDYYGGCGYLGLQNHAALLDAAKETIERYGLSTSAAITLNHPVYRALQAAAQAFFGIERVLIIVSGYMGSVSLAQALADRYERIMIDDQAHSSIWDGARSTGKPISPFRHRDANSLEQVCRETLRAGERPLVISDGVFPVSGEIAPAPEYLAVVNEFDGLLVLDDAHATGVLGENGRGTYEYYGIESDRCFVTHTLSKALGAFGGLIPGDEGLMEALYSRSKVYRGATPPPLPVAAAAVRALEMERGHSQRRQQLWDNVAHARAGLSSLGWPLPNTPVPIICLGAQPGMDLAGMQAELFSRNICIAHSTGYSSVPDGGALRIAIFSTHTGEQIDQLVHELGRLV
jgi:glycine C-acetyltransferase/8-amino-7-oxononanoate synthase